jgi:hypothetical protein
MTRNPLASAPPMRLAALWPDDPSFSTESYLGAIAVASPAAAAWTRSLAEFRDPRGQRDAAIRAAAALLRQPAISATAKAIEAELRRYLTTVWPRESNLASPPTDASALRRELWRIAKLTDGEGLGWRRILDLIE